MRFFDTHAHFDTFHAEGVADAVIRRALDAGVSRIMAVGGCAESNALAVAMAERYPDNLRAAVGFDRDQASNGFDRAAFRGLLAHPLVAAVGEIGLDYHYEPETAEAQQALLKAMLDEALRARLPVVLHVRESEADMLRLLGPFVEAWPDNDRPPGVVHCFTGDAAFASAVLEKGLLISFSGIATFRNADPLRAVARAVPADRIVVETDAPYLAPVPHRGNTNEPAWVVDVAQGVADARGEAPGVLAENTWKNATRLFAWQDGV